MAIRKIVKDGDPILLKVCKPVDRFNLRLWQLLDDMKDTMYDDDGVGLAAPQVGI
ncbi:MAG: peptide deformylase, partial [Oscillospiraceae bacterium]|nr:peptide deformylase [Oscillospiraceae bacterium]